MKPGGSVKHNSTNERKHRTRPLTLHVGEVHGLVDQDKLERKSGSKLKMHRVRRSDRGKSSSLLPEMLKKKVEEINPDNIVLQVGTSSVERPLNPSPADAEYYKQEVIVSACNVFTAASQALNNNSSRTAILMKLPIRSKDSSQKASLSHLYNKTIMDLHKKSKVAERICVIEDRYYKPEVTSDLAAALVSLLHPRELKKDAWNPVIATRRRRVSNEQSTPFTISTHNRFEQLGN